MITFWKEKWQIIRKPLYGLNIGQNLLVKTLLLVLGHLVTDETVSLKNVLSEPCGARDSANGALTGPEPKIFALNHNCSFESVLVPAYLIWRRGGRKISFISDWMYQHIPLLGWVFKQIDPIYVYHKPARWKFLNRFKPEKNGKPAFQKCVERLQQGISIGIFPEGTRNTNPDNLLKGQKGIGYIVLNSLAAVVPVGIDFPLRRTRGRIPKLGSIILRTGTPLKFQAERSLYRTIQAIPNLEPKERQKMINDLAAKITYQIMIEISHLSGKNYPFPEPAPSPLLERFLIKLLAAGMEDGFEKARPKQTPNR
jgi:1-acyl-sn-glycerol-3-phosphate acyltransferase